MSSSFPKPIRLHIFSDFDGTITTKDICNEIFKEFGDFEPFYSKLIQGKIHIKEYWQALFKTLPKEVKISKLIDFVKNISEIDPFFLDFVSFCRNYQIEFEILSDGFDFYIQSALKKIGLEDILYHSNSVRIVNYTIEPVFPYASESCLCNAGSCKRNIALSRLQENEAMVYIGDGYSDFCVAEYSDIIFAKQVLSRYCNVKRIPHYTFKNFSDVRSTLEKILSKGKLKFRRQAYLNRKKAFEIE